VTLVHRARATTLPDLLDRAAGLWDHEAVVFEDDRVTFPALAAAAHDWAIRLLGLGVERGDKVGVLMPNSIEHLAIIFGTAKLGAIPVPINNRFSAPELAHVVDDGELRVVLVANGSAGRDYVGLLREAVGELRPPGLRHLVCLDEEGPPGFLTRAQAEEAGRSADALEIGRRQAAIRIRDTAMIIYTSGTTANPKGCVLNHEGMTRTPFMVAEERFRLDSSDRFWDPLPFCHLSSLVLFHACLAVGATFVAMERFEPGRALKQLAAERCTVAYPCFEPVTTALYEHPDFPSSDLSYLRLLMTIGVPERLRSLQEQVPGVIQISAYGATEYSGVLAFGGPDDPLEKRINTCGRPIPGMEVRIVDPETGEPVRDGEPGELLCRGFGVFDGYYRDPEATARVLDADGWIRSGDLVIQDEDGYLAYHGRLKDMVKVGGENVSAAEIEDVLVQHPAVLVAQVVAAPDARYTEVPAAFVQLRAGRDASEAEIITFCIGRIANFKVPRYVRIVAEWPMSGTKVQKVKLREQISGELAEAGIAEAPKIEGLGAR
jgi:fatty-acyl-CoA synthase